MSNFHICKAINDRAYDLQDCSGHVGHVSVANTQLLLPAEYIVSLLLDAKAFGRTHRYIKDPSLMPDLEWTNPNGSSE